MAFPMSTPKWEGDVFQASEHKLSSISCKETNNESRFFPGTVCCVSTGLIGGWNSVRGRQMQTFHRKLAGYQVV